MENATAWLLSHKKRIWTNVSSALMMGVILALFGAFDFFKLSFNFEKLGDLQYWSRIGFKVAALICVFNIALNTFLPYAENRNVALHRDRFRHDELNARRGSSFDPYINREYNPGEKKKAWVAHINREIHKLGKRAKDQSRMLWGDDRPEFAEMRKKDKYCQKRSVLEAMKSDEWIAANIDTLEVKGFKAIDPTSFNLSIDGGETYKGKKITSNMAGARISKTSSMVLSTVLVSIVSTIWVFGIADAVSSGDQAAMAESVINFLADVGFMAGKFAQGVVYCDRMVENEIHRPYADRIDILIGYFQSEYSPEREWAAMMKEIDKKADAECETLKEKVRKKAEQREAEKVKKAQEAEATGNDLRRV